MIYVYVQQSAWSRWIRVEPVSWQTHTARKRLAKKQGRQVKDRLILPWTDERYWHWYYQVPEKYRSDYNMGLAVRVKVDPAIFEVT